MVSMEGSEPSGTASHIDAFVAQHAQRIADRTSHAQFVHICAPSGFGKTEIARRITGLDGRPVAWCAISSQMTTGALWVAVGRSILSVWPDAPNHPDDVAEGNAEHLVSGCLDIVGPTTLVLDDVDRLDDGALDDLFTRLADIGSVRVVSTSQHGVTPGLTTLEAAGRLVRIGADDLRFDRADCAAMADDETHGAQIHEATAGWPIAVLVSARATRNGASPSLDDSLLQIFSRSHPSFDRSRLAVAALLDRFPESLVDWIRGGGDERRDAIGEDLLIQRNGDQRSIRQWARDALRDDSIDSRLVDEAGDVLRRAGAVETWLTLEIEADRLDVVLPAVELFCAEQIAHGGQHRARRLMGHIPTGRRTVDLRISAVLAEQASAQRRPTETELRELVETARSSDGRPSPRANSALANHLRMVGDASVVEVCHEVVAPLAEAAPDAASQLARSLWPSLPDRIAAAELLRFLGQGMMLTGAPGTFAAGRQMVQSALRILEDEHNVKSAMGWLMYIDALLFVERSTNVVLPARTIALELWRARHSDAALRLSELAMLEFFAGRHGRARSTIELAREASAETGNDLAAIPLAGLECALDVIDEPDDPAHVDAFESTILGLLDHDYLAGFHQVFAAEFGLLQLRLGNRAVAERFAAVADQSPESFTSSSFSLRRRRLHALLALGADRATGEVALRELRELAAQLDRPVLMDLIDHDLAGPTTDPTSDTAPDEELRIVALAPAFEVSRGDCELPTPRGYTARLLALLIASGGTVAMDVALEELWPGTDPRVSRNRLHGVLLRLRRALGLQPDGPLSCRDDLIRLEAGPELSCDAWELETAASSGHADDPAADFLSEQFRYDDRVARYRNYLRTLTPIAAGSRPHG